MKKIVIIFFSILLVSGCAIKDVETIGNKDISNLELVPEKVVPDYVDTNKTPIGIYKLTGNTLTKIHEINTDLVIEKDIGLFQIFPSNDEVINLDKAFGKAFYDEWQKYNSNNDLKIGFNIKYILDNDEEYDYNILNPSQTFDNWEHLMNYLYDDYANLGKGFYSHIENQDFNSNTLFTSFKMQSSYSCGEIKSISLSVFTFDSDDDFLNNSYRGNSIYTINIKINGK